MYVGAYVVNRPDKMYKTAAKLKLDFRPYLKLKKKNPLTSLQQSTTT